MHLGVSHLSALAHDVCSDCEGTMEMLTLGVRLPQICTEEESLEAREALRALMLETGRVSSGDEAEPLLQQEALDKQCADCADNHAS